MCFYLFTFVVVVQPSSLSGRWHSRWFFHHGAFALICCRLVVCLATSSFEPLEMVRLLFVASFPPVRLSLSFFLFLVLISVCICLYITICLVHTIPQRLVPLSCRFFFYHLSFPFVWPILVVETAQSAAYSAFPLYPPLRSFSLFCASFFRFLA